MTEIIYVRGPDEVSAPYLCGVHNWTARMKLALSRRLGLAGPQ